MYQRDLGVDGKLVPTVSFRNDQTLVVVCPLVVPLHSSPPSRTDVPTEPRPVLLIRTRTYVHGYGHSFTKDVIADQNLKLYMSVLLFFFSGTFFVVGGRPLGRDRRVFPFP